MFIHLTILYSLYQVLSETCRLRKRLMLRLYQLSSVPAEGSVSQRLMVYVTLVSDKQPSLANPITINR